MTSGMAGVEGRSRSTAWPCSIINASITVSCSSKDGGCGDDTGEYTGESDSDLRRDGGCGDDTGEYTGESGSVSEVGSVSQLSAVKSNVPPVRGRKSRREAGCSDGADIVSRGGGPGVLGGVPRGDELALSSSSSGVGDGGGDGAGPSTVAGMFGMCPCAISPRRVRYNP